jgi:ribosomal protein S27AE
MPRSQRPELGRPVPILERVDHITGWHHLCPGCGKVFESKQKNRLTCGDRCKARKARAGRKEEKSG